MKLLRDNILKKIDAPWLVATYITVELQLHIFIMFRQFNKDDERNLLYWDGRDQNDQHIDVNLCMLAKESKMTTLVGCKNEEK